MGHFIRGRVVACDTESTGLNTWAGDLPYMFSFANADGDKCSFEFPVDPKTRRPRYEAKPKTFKRLKAFFADRKIKKVFHNSKHDVRHLNAAGIEVLGELGDTELKLRVCDSTRMSYELKPACKELFDVSTDDKSEMNKAVSTLRTKAGKLGFKIATDETHGSGKVAADAWLIQHAERILVDSLKFLKGYKTGTDNARRKMERDAIKRARGMSGLCKRYAEIDAERCVLLELFLEPLLDEYKVRHIYEEEMLKVWPIVFKMEGRGVYINRKVAEAGRARAEKQVKAANNMIRRLCDDAPKKLKLNPATFCNSPQQKIRYFIDHLDFEPIHHTKKGNPKIDHTFLEHVEDASEMAGAIQRQGKGTKACSTYFANYLSEMDEDGIFRGTFQQIGAKTGRFSARLLQQVPKHGKCIRCLSDLKVAGWARDGKAVCGKCGRSTPLDILLEVRRPFGPRPGHVWYMFDFKQIEARIFADEANEKLMLKSFAKDEDVYQKLADVIVDLTGLPVTRQDTKAIFLGKLYGLGLRKLIKAITDAAKGRDVDEDTARGVVEAFDESFPRVSEFMKETIEVAKAERAVYNRYGQRIDIRPPFFDPETGKTFDESYRGVNYIIQSTAARLMKAAMIRCDAFLQELGFGCLVMTIHDELIFEFPLDRRPRWVIQRLADLMSDSKGMFKRVSTPVDVSKTLGSWLEPISVEWATAS